MTAERVELAAAKINLGLEIFGKRPDGYHEVRTVLSTISLHDTLRFEAVSGERDVLALEPLDAPVPDASNLAVAALSAMRRAGAAIPPQRVTITKRIPVAAGLGGASSDAAATIRAFRPELDTCHGEASVLAAALGSDVPFFLDGPAALASGRGELLTPLPAPKNAWVVLAVPEIDIPDKTATMYAAVDKSWWSGGHEVQHIAESLPDLPGAAPVNTFDRALLIRHPELRAWRDRLTTAGFPFAALTGAGPTHYTLVGHENDARSIAARLTAGGVRTLVARLGAPRPEQPDA